MHLARERHLDFPVFTLDTGLLFPETIALKERLESFFGIVIESLVDDFPCVTVTFTVTPLPALKSTTHVVPLTHQSRVASCLKMTALVTALIATSDTLAGQHHL
jgi:3'-phosphoadenosine 5'-phosphosulfate sulfotransferase (PAPS reductase)/FAD synthetase